MDLGRQVSHSRVLSWSSRIWDYVFHKHEQMRFYWQGRSVELSQSPLIVRVCWKGPLVCIECYQQKLLGWTQRWSSTFLKTEYIVFHQFLSHVVFCRLFPSRMEWIPDHTDLIGQHRHYYLIYLRTKYSDNQFRTLKVRL